MSHILTVFTPNINILQLLRQIAAEAGLQLTDLRIRKLRQRGKGENYLGEVTHVEISDTNQHINVIVKVSAKNETFRKRVPINEVYQREIYVYTRLIPIFKHLETINGINNPLSYIVKCYKTSSEEEVIILEDLTARGFSLAEWQKPLDWNHCKLILQLYGRWHALSYALKFTNREQWEEIKVELRSNALPQLADFFNIKTIVDRTWKELAEEMDPNKDWKYINSLRKFMRNLQPMRKSIYELNDYSVILHADGWINNFIFKYEENVPKEVCLIDFQMCAIGSPAFDISHFLYSCTDQSVFNNLNECLHIYHQSLSEHLHNFHINVDTILPISLLKEEWKKISRYGFSAASFYIKVMLTDKNEVVNVVDSCSGETKNTFLDRINNMTLYKKRVKDVLVHLVDNEYL